MRLVLLWPKESLGVTHLDLCSRWSHRVCVVEAPHPAQIPWSQILWGSFLDYWIPISKRLGSVCMSVTLLVLVRSCLSFLLPQLTASQRWGDEEPSSSEVHLSHREGRRGGQCRKEFGGLSLVLQGLWRLTASLGRVLPNSPWLPPTILTTRFPQILKRHIHFAVWGVKVRALLKLLWGETCK